MALTACRQYQMTLVLDLNGVLCDKVPKGSPADVECPSYNIAIRRGAEEFLAECARDYDVGLFSSSRAENVTRALSAISFDDWAFIRTRDDTVPDDEIGGHHTLKLVDDIPGRVVIVDDERQKIRLNPLERQCVHGNEPFAELKHRIDLMLKDESTSSSIAESVVAAPTGWESVFEQAAPELELLRGTIKTFQGHCPSRDDLFRAFDLCPLDRVRVVIVGSEPSAECDDDNTPRANGLAYSTRRDAPIDDVQRAIFAELCHEQGDRVRRQDLATCKARRDYFRRFYRIDIAGSGDEDDLVHAEYQDNEFKTRDGDPLTDEQYDASVNAPIRNVTDLSHDEIVAWTRSSDDDLKSIVSSHTKAFSMPKHGDLSSWARQGVLLLNTCLTTEKGVPRAHGHIWNGFLIRVLNAVEETNPDCVYLLWGAKAHSIAGSLSQNATVKLAAHPLKSRKDQRISSFAGCGHFTFVNKQLDPPIDWRLE